MAARFWPRQDALGKQLTLHGPDHTQTSAQVVGIAKNGKYQSLGEDAKPFLYRCLLQDYQPGVQVVVRTRGNPAAVIGVLRREVQRLDSRMALVGAETLEQHMQLPLFPAQAAAWFWECSVCWRWCSRWRDCMA